MHQPMTIPYHDVLRERGQIKPPGVKVLNPIDEQWAARHEAEDVYNLKRLMNYRVKVMLGITSVSGVEIIAWL